MPQESAPRRLVSLVLGREPGRSVANLEEFRNWEREPGFFTFVFGWTDLQGRVHAARSKVVIRNVNLPILKHHEQLLQDALRQRFRVEGHPESERAAFTERMALDMATRVTALLTEAYPEVGAKTMAGRMAIRFGSWIILTTPLVRQEIDFARLVTLQIIFSFTAPLGGAPIFVPMIALDHGDPPPRTRN